ncbi:hypothetical protein GCM10007063_08850 [Lentibacillus kapialis]|uniref:Uncharacterized protein n=1 Tax=Lentibacillus kapialis TaxID=340214 RepID=A0A917PRQ5_9BACI|nr:hypothetical protein [Lentibacillus kapialis]GGJ88550.1 hypothetical protein GCM10007063_08850 [Lentibacillus kapialis]
MFEYEFLQSYKKANEGELIGRYTDSNFVNPSVKRKRLQEILRKYELEEPFSGYEDTISINTWYVEINKQYLEVQKELLKTFTDASKQKRKKI